jgi:hypothetical protein
MSSALKNVIVSAILKVTSDPAYAGREYASPDAAREDFTKALIELLFPENPSVPAVKERKKPGPKPKLDEHGNPIRKPRSPKSVASPDSLASSSPAKEKKKPGPKPKLDENGQPIKKVKQAKTEAPASPASTASKEKKPRAPMSEEAKAAMVAKRKATMEAKKAAEPQASPKTPKKETPPLPASPPKAPKKAKKAAEPEASPKKSPKKAKKAAEPEASPKKSPKKAKTEEPKPSPKKAKKPSAEPASANLDKFTGTQKKWLTEVAGDKEIEKKDVLSYLNGLSNAAFNDKPLKDHFRDYIASLAPAKAEEPAAEPKDLIEVEFDGETYAVNPETKRVYTVDENGNGTPVGYVGMAKFEKMELEEYEEDDE